ncbi:MAG: hypothetical protein ACK4QW_17515 [Alphaproteobacteria bacterium]
MGGLFSTPKIPEPKPLPDPGAEAAENERRERERLLLRRLRGRGGLVATGPRGLMRVDDAPAERRSLLGR